MKPTTLIAILFIAITLINTRATAQNVYRCGDTYSDKPCAEGVSVNVLDKRTRQQKSESVASTQREAAAAQELEKARLRQEASLNPKKPELVRSADPKNTAKPKTAATDAGAGAKPTPAPKSEKKNQPTKKKEPEFFTARSVADKPKPRASAGK